MSIISDILSRFRNFLLDYRIYILNRFRNFLNGYRRDKVDYHRMLLMFSSLASYTFIIILNIFDINLLDSWIPYNLFLLFVGLSFIFHKIIETIIKDTELPDMYRKNFFINAVVIFFILFRITTVKNNGIQQKLSFKTLSFAADMMSFNKEIKMSLEVIDSYYFFCIFILTIVLSITWLLFFSEHSKSFRIFLAVSCNMSIYLIPFIYHYGIYGINKPLEQYILFFLIIIISMGYFIVKTIELMNKNEDKNIFWYSLTGIIILIVIAVIFGFFYFERGHFLQKREQASMDFKEKTNWNDVYSHNIPFELGSAVVKENKFLNDLEQVYNEKSKRNKNVAIRIIGSADEKHIKGFGGKYNSNYELGKARAEGVKKIILERNVINPKDISIISTSSEALTENHSPKKEVRVIVTMEPNQKDPRIKYFGSLHQAFFYSVYAIAGNIYDKVGHRDDLIIIIFSIVEFLFGIVIITCIVGSTISNIKSE